MRQLFLILLLLLPVLAFGQIQGEIVVKDYEGYVIRENGTPVTILDNGKMIKAGTEAFDQLYKPTMGKIDTLIWASRIYRNTAAKGKVPDFVKGGMAGKPETVQDISSYLKDGFRLRPDVAPQNKGK